MTHTTIDNILMEDGSNLLLEDGVSLYVIEGAEAEVVPHLGGVTDDDHTHVALRLVMKLHEERNRLKLAA